MSESDSRMVIRWEGYMQGYELTVITGFNFLIGNKLGPVISGSDSIRLCECGFLESGLIWVQPYHEVPYRIGKFPGMMSSVYICSPNLIGAGGVANIFICVATTAATVNTAVQYILSYPWCKSKHRGHSVDTHFHDRAERVSLLFLIMKVANTSNKENFIAKLIFCK